MDRDYVVHPGWVMRYITMSIGKSPRWLAKQLGVKTSVVKKIFNGEIWLSLKLAQEFEKVTGYPSDSLISLQLQWDTRMGMVNYDNKGCTR